MLSRFAVVGRINWYRRTDGTVDLGLTAEPFVDLDQELDEVFLRYQRNDLTDAITRLSDVVELLTTTDTLAVSEHVNRPAAIKRLQLDLEKLRRDQAARERITKTSAKTHRGRPKGPKRFADLLIA